MLLKVGDRIRYIGPTPLHYVGRMGVIEEARGKGRDFPYKIRFDKGLEGKGFWYPVLEYEIEKISSYTKGQQLLFSFMDE